jgi:Acetyltransferase (GNAT) domain
VLEDGRRLVLPMLRRVPFPGVVLDDSYPGNYGAGGLLASGGLRASDVTHVLTDLLRAPATRTLIKTNYNTARCWDAGHVRGVKSIAGRVEVLDLDGGFPRVWERRFHSSARRAVRKAERSRLEVQCDSAGRLISTFYDLYLDWTARRAKASGLPPSVAVWRAKRREPSRMFQAVAAMPGDSCRVWVASYDGEPVATMITLVYRQQAVYWRGYSKKAIAGPLRANNLLQRLAIEDACVAGCRWYSMGDSGGVASLIHFKQTLGATPRRTVACRIERVPISALETVKHRAEESTAMLLSGGHFPRRNPRAAGGSSGSRSGE